VSLPRYHIWQQCIFAQASIVVAGLQVISWAEGPYLVNCLQLLIQCYIFCYKTSSNRQRDPVAFLNYYEKTKKFTAFYRIQSLIQTILRTCHYNQSKPDKSIPQSHIIFHKHPANRIFHLYLDLPSRFLPFRFSDQNFVCSFQVLTY
jgi:hypothetical protein